MCFFSVIMPVYNAAAYLEEAINSVLGQTYRDFELILVDDGSNDGSAVKCDQFAQQDHRIKVVHIQNSGISNARNVGMKMAKGEYLAFCDHDDEYSSVLMETVRQYIDAYDRPNVLKYTARRIKVWQGRQYLISFCKQPEKNIKIRELVSDYSLLLNFERYIWDGVYKREFVEKNMLCFDTTITKGGEDWYFNLELLEKADKIVFINQFLYTHFYRDGQNTSTKYDESNYNMYIKNAEKEFILINRFHYDNRTLSRIMVMHKARYAVEMASEYVYKSGCNLEKSVILKKIEGIRKISAYKHKDSVRAFFYLYRRCFKWGILYSAFSLHQTWLMYFIMRWNQQLRYKNRRTA